MVKEAVEEAKKTVAEAKEAETDTDETTETSEKVENEEADETAKDTEKKSGKKLFGKKKDKKEKSEKDKEVTPLTFDLENCRDRIIRLTVNSSHLGDAVLSPDGDKLYYQASFEDGADLWVHDLKEQKTENLLKDIGSGSPT